MTLTQLIKSARIRMTYKLAQRPDADTWPRGASHYRVTLRCGRRQHTLWYSQGPAVCREPRLVDVLSCLQSDCRASQNTFDDFCAEYGYNNDSRRAERAWRDCGKTYAAVDRLLGRHLLDFGGATEES
jgi:hypothetical protein